MTSQSSTRWPAGRPHRTFKFAALPALLTLVAACSSGAASSTASLTAIVATASPVPTAEVSAAPTATPTATPSPTVVIVKVTPIPGAPDSGIVIQLAAKTDLWSLTHIDVPAGRVWHVQIDNPGGTHNFTVASGPTVPERIYVSKRFETKGPFTFDIPALPAGSYLFICTLHPLRMTGTLTIG